MINPQIDQLTDKELYKLCQKCGHNIRRFQKEFAGYMPEVEKRKLYKKYGCLTLYEFAAKLAGMSRDTVDDIMNIHKKLEDKPVLQSLIGTQGWSKVKVVATIARPETEKFWAEKVQVMAKETLKTFVKELRKEANEVVTSGQTDLFANIAEFSIPRPEPSTPMNTSQKAAITFKLDADAESKLKIFKHRLEKKTGEPQDWNQTMKALLKIAGEHEACAKLNHPTTRSTAKGKITPRQKTAPTKQEIQASIPCQDKRYIPARVKHYLEEKYQGACGFPNCKNPSEIHHHTKRFSLEPNHNPDYIVPLCKNHERLAHHGLIENEELPPENWKIQPEPDKNSPKYTIDQQVQHYRTPVS